MPAADHRARLTALIAQSGLSAAAFARLVVGRDERTVRRWLSGDVAIPESAAGWMERVEVQSRPGSIVVTITR